MNQKPNNSDQFNQILHYQANLKNQFKPQQLERTLREKVLTWDKEMKLRIETATATSIRALEESIRQANNRFTKSMELATYTIDLLKRLRDQNPLKIKEIEDNLKDCEEQLRILSSFDVQASGTPHIQLVSRSTTNDDDKDGESFASGRSSWSHPTSAEGIGSSYLRTPQMPNQQLTLNNSFTLENFSQGAIFPLNLNPQSPTFKFFDELRRLPPMIKNVPSNNRLESETRQMEEFLMKVFEFENIRGEELAPGVRSFKLSKPIEKWDPNATIYFPSKTQPIFYMKASEILEWQKSYRAYSYQELNGINEGFLSRALSGKSQNGKEAFLMKFVVRVSTCPILMKFDGLTIPRQLNENWPNSIKLVSVSGIDFAGRRHDADDITTYIKNYEEIFETDGKSRTLIVRNGRDFIPRPRAGNVSLRDDRLFADLQKMARLRLKVCDLQNVHVVIETGLGLGTFVGKQIGIEIIVRQLSARAIRSVLEEDGSSFQAIRAIIFALPIFNTNSTSDGSNSETFDIFVDEFQRNYTGRIPVLVVDQDMHQLAVEIAKKGLCVSELNPADSHAVFGQAWQTCGPGVEEKLAITTLGLLTQHHLINRSVLDPKNYRFI